MTNNERQALQKFAKYISTQWVNPPQARQHWHSYPITKSKVWSAWRQEHPTSQSQWWCDSLGQAAEHYSWEPEGATTFSSLSGQLQDAIASGNLEATAQICDQIYDWGGVGKATKGKSNQSRVWVSELKQNGKLIGAIKRACELLHPSCNEVLSEFHSDGLLMNSATTKIFAAADPTILMYDGRVGAALGLLVVRYLKDGNSEPERAPLMFGWGAPRETKTMKRNNRNPSTAKLTFREINGISDADRALMCRNAAYVAQCVAADLKSEGVDVRQIEKALFMVGYRLTGSESA